MASPAEYTFEEKLAIRNRYLSVDTSNVADVLDKMGVFNQGLSGDFRAFPASGKIAGWAYTIRGQMVPYEGSGDSEKMRACHGVSALDVSVWSGDGKGICYFGELIALGMMERGCVGALVDGGIRDVRWLIEHKFPVFAKYRTPVQSIGRWLVTTYQESVFLSGATTERVQVNPGDFILGDEDGVIAIPKNLIEPVLESAETLTRIEIEIRDELSKGLSLAEALKKYGHV